MIQKKAIITGSGGLVGAEASCFFSEKGFQVIGIDNDIRKYFFGESASTRKNCENLQKELPNYVHLSHDIRDYAALENHFKNYGSSIEVVIHTAAQPSHDWSAKEPMGLSNQRLLWRLMNPVQKIVKWPIVGIVLSKMFRVFSRSLDHMQDKIELYRDNGRMRAELHNGYKYAAVCNECSVKNICDGFHGDYANIFGTNEAQAIKLEEAIDDPCYYVCRQSKIVESPDESWALP